MYAASEEKNWFETQEALTAYWIHFKTSEIPAQLSHREDRRSSSADGETGRGIWHLYLLARDQHPPPEHGAVGDVWIRVENCDDIATRGDSVPRIRIREDSPTSLSAEVYVKSLEGWQQQPMDAVVGTLRHPLIGHENDDVVLGMTSSSLGWVRAKTATGSWRQRYYEAFDGVEALYLHPNEVTVVDAALCTYLSAETVNEPPKRADRPRQFPKGRLAAHSFPRAVYRPALRAGVSAELRPSGQRAAPGALAPGNT